jgi:flagellar hook-length control protein FliK
MKVSPPAKPRSLAESGFTAAVPKPKRASFAAVLKGKKNMPRAEAGMEPQSQGPEDAPGMGPGSKSVAQKARRGEAEQSAAAALLGQTRSPVEPAVRVSASEKAQAPAADLQVDALVREISVAVQGHSTQIDIHLQSQTLDGLHIRISGDQAGSIAIQFLTASPQVAEFLSANVDRLSAALAEREIAVSEIGVANGTGAAPQKAGAGARRGRR